MRHDGFVPAGDDRDLTLPERFKEQWEAMEKPFVVAHLATTGLDDRTDEILQISAILADPSGAIASEFSALVRVTNGIPDYIQEETGISEARVGLEGRPLAEVMRSLLAFVGSSTLFIHNAPFEVAFLSRAAQLCGQSFESCVYDTQEIGFYVWPNLRARSVGALARRLGIGEARDRELAETKVLLTVLLAAREEGVKA
jgi:DNA polymerase-3 subunit epsilon